jgi:N-acetylglucosamine-6-phosphate deacetylase
MQVIIQASSAVIEGELKADTWIEVSNGTITAINSGLHQNPDKTVNGTVIPGFIDIHCHGGSGSYFSDAPSISDVIELHKKHGTTGVVASLVTADIDNLKSQISNLVPFYEAGEILGIHLEGPYLSHARCGAHEPSLLINPDIADIKELLDVAAGAIEMITIAPELPGATEAIKFLSAAGVKIAIGHTNGDFKDAAAGTNAGATIVTHFMNAMSKEKSEGSISSFVLVDERLSVELILDGHHVPFGTSAEIIEAIGDRVVLVTDAMAAAGCTDGNYNIGKLAVKVEDSVARLEINGALAGSTLTMDKAFMNAINECGVSLEQAVLMSSTNAAKALGLKDRGSITVGMRADLLSYDSATQSVTLIS